MATNDPGEPRRPGIDEPERPDAETRRHGLSPVVEGRDRSKVAMIAGFLAIMLVVGALFVTSGKNSNAAPAMKSPPAIAASPGLAPTVPAPPPLPPVLADGVPAGFPPPPVPGQAGSAPGAGEKEDARRHAPMLIYDVSGASPQAVGKPSPADDVQSALTNQLLKSTAATLASMDGGGSGSPSEGYADRTLAYGKAASDQQAPEASARRISMGNRIAQGKMLTATLETAISSDLPGKLRAVVTADVWSEDGSRPLVQRGSRLIGEYRSGLVRGNTRVFVIWTRLLQPDGTDIAIG
ncbi:MAG: TrbI/VirB10 family protein, partial [Dongiaceae bacterium]